MLECKQTLTSFFAFLKFYFSNIQMCCEWLIWPLTILIDHWDFCFKVWARPFKEIAFRVKLLKKKKKSFFPESRTSKNSFKRRRRRRKNPGNYLSPLSQKLDFHLLIHFYFCKLFKPNAGLLKRKVLKSELRRKQQIKPHLGQLSS